jgi:hypothetical protein
MAKYLYTLVTFFILAGTAFATVNLRDPTYPEGFIDQSTILTHPVTLSAILISPDRRVAVLNDQPAMVGEEVSGYKIIEIQPNFVVLDGAQGRITLFLLNQVPVKQDSLKQG